MTYLCRVAYLGWYFHGTNVQPGVRTVEGDMERSLRGKVRFLSRTDKGVSAMNNYALCHTSTSPAKANEIEGLWVIGYRKINRRPVVAWRWYRYYYPERIEVDKTLLNLFVGKKNFSSFAITEGKNPTREILSFKVTIEGEFTVFDIIGRSFLRQMVRRIVNAVVMAQRGEIDLEELFKNPKERAVPPAPAEGLVLINMKIQPQVPADEKLVNRVASKMKDEWLKYAVKERILSSRYFLGKDL